MTLNGVGLGIPRGMMRGCGIELGLTVCLNRPELQCMLRMGRVAPRF